MAKLIKQWIDAGPLHLEILRPRGSRSDTDQVRQAKRKLSSEAQKRLNDKHSSFRLELDLACNYVPGDLILTLTYDPEHLPFRRSQCANALKYFRRKLAEEYGQHGAALCAHWNIENKHGEGRWHHHMVINAADVDYQTITALWGRGDVYFDRLRLDKDHSYEALARYMTKERPDKPGQRCWSCTRTAKHPIIETALVDADTTLNPPKGSQLVERKTGKNQYGRTEYIKYLNAELPRRKTNHRKKQKR